MQFLFLSKSPIKRTPSIFPNRVPMKRAARLQDFFFLHISHIPYKIPLNKEVYPFSQRPQERSVPPCSPKAGPLWKQTSIFRALLSIYFGVPSKGAVPPGFPHRVPSERDDRILFTVISSALLLGWFVNVELVVFLGVVVMTYSV